MSYDPENIFAKIIRGEIPCHKIFETEHVLAILDAFPMAEGHALLLPKAPCVNLLDMSPTVASAYMAELPRLARLVQAATGAVGVNIVQNNGADAGQMVFHCHIHVIPRFANDKKVTLSPSGPMLSPDKAKPILDKMQSVDSPWPKTYAASLGLIDSLLADMKAGTITPPKTAPAALPAASGKKKDEAKKGDAPPQQPKKEKKPPTEEEKAKAAEAAKAKKEAKKKGGDGGEGGGGGGGPKGGDDARAIDISWAEIRVGKIIDASPHEGSDKLYLESIDLGEPTPRQVLSGLQQHMSVDQVKGAEVVCICNLKARKIAGTESQAMVLCASDESKSKLCFVSPPKGAKPGELVTWGESYPGEFEVAKKMDKKKAWESIQPLLATDGKGTCIYKGEKGVAPFTCKAGVCTATVTGGIIS